MKIALGKIDVDGLLRFRRLEADASRTVADRFYASHGPAYAHVGQCRWEACQEDLTYTLEFLRTVLEFGLLQPMVDYLRWLESVLDARSIPAAHLVQSLDWLAEYFETHMPGPDGALVCTALHAATAEFLNKSDSPPANSQPTDPWPETASFQAALLAGRQRDAVDIMNACLNEGRDFVQFELGVILPAMYRIGELWQANRVSVAQEHMATAIVQFVMAAGLLHLPPPPLNEKRVLLACVEGNHHVIGLRMVADAFLLSGWNVQFLGSNVSTPWLVGQVAEWNPDLVGLSVSFAHQMPTVKTVIRALQERFGLQKPAVMIGGLAINRFAPMAGALGADAQSENAPSAVADADRVAGLGERIPVPA